MYTWKIKFRKISEDVSSRMFTWCLFLSKSFKMLTTNEINNFLKFSEINVKKICNKLIALSCSILVVLCFGTAAASSGGGTATNPKPTIKEALTVTGIKSVRLENIAKSDFLGIQVSIPVRAIMPVAGGDKSYALFANIMPIENLSGDPLTPKGLEFHLQNNNAFMGTNSSFCILDEEIHSCFVTEDIDDVNDYDNCFNTHVKTQTFPSKNQDYLEFDTNIQEIKIRLEKTDSNKGYDKLVFKNGGPDQIKITNLEHGKYLKTTNISSDVPIDEKSEYSFKLGFKNDQLDIIDGPYIDDIKFEYRTQENWDDQAYDPFEGKVTIIMDDSKLKKVASLDTIRQIAVGKVNENDIKNLETNAKNDGREIDANDYIWLIETNAKNSGIRGKNRGKQNQKTIEKFNLLNG